MIKRKKKIIAAFAAVSVLAAGAAFALLPNRHVAEAAPGDAVSAEASYWKQTPQISGWTWGSYSAEKNIFTAIPGEYYDYQFITFTFQKQGESSTLLTSYARVEAEGELVYYKKDPWDGHDIKLTGAGLTQYLEENFAKWDVGDYTMTAAVDATVEYPYYASSVNFSVQKAKNYWTEIPRLQSWYVGEWTSASQFPTPKGEAAYGITEYTIYGSKADNENEIDYDAVYYKGTSNPDAIPDNRLNTAGAGFYFLVAHVEGTDNYGELDAVVPFRIFTSEATLAELQDRIASALKDAESFAQQYEVNIALGEIQAAMNRIKNATSTSAVQVGLTSTKVAIYRVYAKNRIQQYAEDLEADITIDDPSLSEENESINNAPDVATIDVNLESALAKIYTKGVENARKAATAELLEYAAKFGVEAHDSFADAATFEEVAERLAKWKREIAENAFNGTGEVTDLDAYKASAREAILKYAEYVGIEVDEDASDTQINLHLTEIALAGTREEVDAAYNEASKYITAELTRVKADLLLELRKVSIYYGDKYPLGKDAVDKILSAELNGSARDEIYDAPTMVSARTAYGINENKIKTVILPFAKDKCKQDLTRAAEDASIPGFSAEVQKYMQQIEDAATVDEVEAVLAAAVFAIGNTLFSARMQMMREFEAFAAEYFADYNWADMKKALEDGKNQIYNAVAIADIYKAGDAAKLSFVRAYTISRLDYYGEIYGAYNIADIITARKAECKGVDTINRLNTILTNTEELICSAIQINAPRLFQIARAHFSKFDTSKAEAEIKKAQTMEEAHAIYTAEIARLDELKAQTLTARNMLEMYAESYGLSVSSDAVLKAMDKLYAAVTPEDIPELVIAAKADIDAAAKAEQSRVGSVNNALIACTVIFAVAAVALAVLLTVMYMKKKKGSTAPESAGKETPVSAPKPEKPQTENQPENKEEK